MSIDVAVGAAPELQPLECRGDAAEGPVTALALDRRVRAPERIPGLLVEGAFPGHALHFLPVVVRVAAGALRAQPTFVGVLVAVHAGRVRDGAHPHELFRVRRHRRVLVRIRVGHALVALRALDRGVLPQQGEPGLRVAESRRLLPGRLIVAVRALAAELPSVLVEVTLGALGGQTEEGDALQTFRARRADGCGLEQPIVVALGAVDLGMLAPQGISGLGVIEAFLPFGSPEQIEFPALVLLVALLAGQLGGREPPMQSPVVGHALLDGGVAGEARVVRQLRARDVALGAIPEALEVRVAGRQRAWGEHVRAGPGGREQKRGSQEPVTGTRHSRGTPRRRCALRSRSPGTRPGTHETGATR